MNEIKRFEEWRSERGQRKAAMRAMLAVAMEEGIEILEEMGTHKCLWPTNSPFIHEANTPDYLADHLVSRHYGFCTTLTVNGLSYKDGQLI